jgi:hypothetical protein
MDNRDFCMLTNIHSPPQEGNFHDEQGTAIKPEIVVDCKRHMGYVDKGDRMANSHSISCQTCKWMKKLFFHLFDLAVVNSYILFSSYGGKKFSQRFLTRPSEEHAGSGWTRMAARETCRENTHCSFEHRQTGYQLQ